MEVNFWAILISAVFAMAFGYLWYGPLFGKKWLMVMHATPDDLAKREAMQKSAGPLYVVQFLLAFLQLYILAHFIKGWTDVSGIESALWIWLGFVMPTLAGSAMWNNLSGKQKGTLFLLTAGYQLVCFIVFGFILGKLQ